MDELKNDESLGIPGPDLPPELEPPVVVEVPKQDEPELIRQRMMKILAEHGGMESNIPLNRDHEYWQLRAQHQRLTTP